jgi:hypothetical protein
MNEAAANLATPWFDDPPPPPDPPQTDTDDTKGERAGKVTPPKKN